MDSVAVQKMGISESLDVINYADALVKGLAANRNAAGQIDTADVVKTVIQTSPDAIKAVVGSWDIPKEVGDLDETEKKQLLDAAMALVFSVVGLFVPAKA